MTHLNSSSKKLGKIFKLQKEILKTEMNHDAFYADTWENKKNERLDYVKNNVICTAFSCSRYTKAMEKISGFGMKDCLSLIGTICNSFNSLGTEDEPVYIYKDKY